jgi:hypothetical protein
MKKNNIKVRRFLSFLLAITFFFHISSSHALMPAPYIGINYETMIVDNPSILKNAGMDDVVEGDKIVISFHKDGKIEIKNERTGVTILMKED